MRRHHNPMAATHEQAPRQRGRSRPSWRERLRARIEAKQLNPKEVARQIGVGLALVYDTLKGRDPSIKNFAKIAEFLGFSLDELYYGGIHPSKLSSISEKTTYECSIIADRHTWEHLDPIWDVYPPVKLDVDLMLVLVGSNWPMLEEDDVLICKKFEGDGALQDFSRHIAIIETVSGDRLVGSISKSRMAGQVLIRRFDRSVAPVSTRLRWAAVVVGTLRSTVAHPAPR